MSELNVEILSSIPAAALTAVFAFLAAWMAITAAAKRDFKNHRREKLEELSALSVELHDDVIGVRHSFPEKHSDATTEVQTSEFAQCKDRWNKQPTTTRMRLLVALWFPQAKCSVDVLHASSGKFAEAAGVAELAAKASIATDYTQRRGELVACKEELIEELTKFSRSLGELAADDSSPRCHHGLL